MLLDIPIEKIKPPSILLRPVLVNSLEFLQLVDSIRNYGIMNSILVRPDGENYQLIDGNWRLNACVAAGQETIPAICKDIPDDLVTTYQVITNATGKPTEPIEFARHLERIRRSHGEDMEIGELAILIRRSPKWISEMLNLIKLSPEIKLLVNRGEIPLGSAHTLARLPFALRPQVLQEARIKSVAEFTKLCGRLLKLYREEVKNGRMEDVCQSKESLLAGQADAFQRSLKAVQAEIKSKEFGGLIINLEDCVTALQGFYAGLRWTIHKDKNSVDQRVKKVLAKREAKEAAKRKRQKNRKKED